MSAQSLVEELLKLDLVRPGQRKHVCELLFQYIGPQRFKFGLEELIALLHQRLKSVHHHEIIFSNQVNEGNGSTGTVYNGMLFGVNRTLLALYAIKLDKEQCRHHV